MVKTNETYCDAKKCKKKYFCIRNLGLYTIQEKIDAKDKLTVMQENLCMSENFLMYKDLKDSK